MFPEKISFVANFFVELSAVKVDTRQKKAFHSLRRILTFFLESNFFESTLSSF